MWCSEVKYDRRPCRMWWCVDTNDAHPRCSDSSTMCTVHCVGYLPGPLKFSKVPRAKLEGQAGSSGHYRQLSHPVESHPWACNPCSVSCGIRSICWQVRCHWVASWPWSQSYSEQISTLYSVLDCEKWACLQSKTQTKSKAKHISSSYLENCTKIAWLYSHCIVQSSVRILVTEIELHLDSILPHVNFTHLKYQGHHTTSSLSRCVLASLKPDHDKRQ